MNPVNKETPGPGEELGGPLNVPDDRTLENPEACRGTPLWKSLAAVRKIRHSTAGRERPRRFNHIKQLD